MIPPDRERCQAEITTYTPFVMGGPTSRTERCPSAPAYIATEAEPGPDGQKGSMSLCAPCRQVMESDPKYPKATFEPIATSAQLR